LLSDVKVIVCERRARTEVRGQTQAQKINDAFSETQLSRQITPRTKNGHAPPIT